MNVVLVSPYNGVQGGISRWTEHIIEYYNGLTDKECELILVPTGRTKFINENMPLAKRLLAAWTDYRKIFKNYFSKLQPETCDLVHITSSASLSLLRDWIMIKAAKRKGIKTVLHFRFGRIPELSKKKNWEWKLLNKIVRITDKVVVIDQSSVRTLVDKGYNNIHYLVNPISPRVLNIIRTNYGIKREKRLILFTGHVVKTKGVFELINACKRIENVKLRLVGRVTDDIRKELFLIAGKDSSEWLEITGEKPYEDVIRDMLTCELFVLPTYTEGFPNVILEAMASECAIITTPVGAIPQMLAFRTPNPQGLEVEVGNTDWLKSSIEYALNHPDEMREMAKQAKEHVMDEYIMENIWHGLINLWMS